jgi:hypothetical protein
VELAPEDVRFRLIPGSAAFRRAITTFFKNLLLIKSPRRVRFSNGTTNLLSVRLYMAQYAALTAINLIG